MATLSSQRQGSKNISTLVWFFLFSSVQPYRLTEAVLHAAFTESLVALARSWPRRVMCSLRKGIWSKAQIRCTFVTRTPWWR